MIAHLRANLCLLVLTVAICSVLYPLALLAIGRTVFPDQAEGSLLAGKDGTPIGSRLLAQPFGGDGYFQPRPSAVSYNAAASGASNWGASNYLLRDRVARTLGVIARYKNGSLRNTTVQQDVVEWFKGKPDIVADWAKAHAGVAQAWVNAGDKHKAAVTAWLKEHPEELAVWKKANSAEGAPQPSDLAVPFFVGNARKFHENWPKLIDDATWSREAVFFDAWLAEHRDADLEKVPGDLVTTSGSGLDPHITVSNAHYQADRVIAARAAKSQGEPARLRPIIEELLQQRSFEPLGGLAGGEALVNVLELNLSLDARMKSLQSR